MSSLRIGTRGSLLAMAQANRLKDQLSALHHGLEIELVPIRTSGDDGRREQLGAFVHELQLALLDGRVDAALHCLKDIPTERAPGLSFAAHLQREDVRDTIITRGHDWNDLEPGSTIGTGSVRRTSQLAALRSDFRYKPLVGNVDTRLRKLMAGEYDAIVLAIAGLKRLGVLDTWEASPYNELLVEPLSAETMLPAPGQAILVIETREDDSSSIELVRPLHCADTELEADAERSFLKAFGGGCSVPVAAWAQLENDSIELQGLVAAPDGKQIIRGCRHAARSEAAEVGEKLAQELIALGAMDLFNQSVTA